MPLYNWTTYLKSSDNKDAIKFAHNRMESMDTHLVTTQISDIISLSESEDSRFGKPRTMS